MKHRPALVLATLLLAGAVPGHAGDVLLELDWATLDDPPAGGTVVATDRGWSALRIAHAGGEARLFALARLDDPGISRAQYAISGEVRYEGVAAGSFLEMWNVLPGDLRFFSRTLGTSGPMRSLGGSSDWHRFVLPAFLQDHPERPVALEINLALTGPGTVEIGPLTLTEFAAPEDVAAAAATRGPAGGAAGSWWSSRTAVLVGGLGGAGLGLLAALLGVLLGLGRARPLVTGAALALLVAGLAALGLGILAVVRGQPYAVYYPLLLLGGLTAVCMTGLLILAPRRYESLELRRMRAMDVP